MIVVTNAADSAAKGHLAIAINLMNDQSSSVAKPQGKPRGKSASARRVFLPVKQDEEEQEPKPWIDLKSTPSWLASFLLNSTLILILALFVIRAEIDTTVNIVAAESDATSMEDIQLNLDDLNTDALEAIESDLAAAPTTEFSPESEPLVIDTEILNESAEVLAGESSNFDGNMFSELAPADLANEIGGRGTNTRRQLLNKFGGNAASENAVQLGLQWIADHQLPDGGWSLDHTIGPKINNRPRTSPNPGSYQDARLGATALALLPFLGNGQTHRNGKYKQVVFDGLKFLMEQPTPVGKGLSYRDLDGTMYSHGLVAIVFNECYAMTGDEQLRDFAQGTLTFIEESQHPTNGGWRYEIREKGDTSAVGWQLMALKSGKLAGLDVNKRPFKLANEFLDDVSIESGAFYGYRVRPVEMNRVYRGTTSVGLLCRMYNGWQQDNRALAEGVQWMADQGPDTNLNQPVNMYYNYYATQVMKHYGDPTWRVWNVKMRDFLIETQSKNGVTKGSWFYNPDGQYQGPGGRLYVTSLACLTLEVYYRYLPIYSSKAVETDEFPLD